MQFLGCEFGRCFRNIKSDKIIHQLYDSKSSGMPDYTSGCMLHADQTYLINRRLIIVTVGSRHMIPSTNTKILSIQQYEDIP